ncbi:ABC transporter permease [Schleiferilactobacillus shenzhenensis]|nr:ABC transporter permease [Schleiferilactobacillus shenzhenensis]
MRALFKVTFKRDVQSTTNIVIFAALVILLLGTFFSQTGQANTTRGDLYNVYVTTDDGITNEVIALRKVKHRTAAQTARLNQKLTEKTYADQIIAAASASPAAADQLNRALLHYAQYALRQTQKDPRTPLQLIAYTDQPLDRSLLGRVKDVAFYRYLLDHHIQEIPTAAVHAPAINYLAGAFLYHVSPFLIIAVLLVGLAEFFTMDKRLGTIDFANTLPISKSKVLLIQGLLTCLLMFVLFLLAAVAVFLLVGSQNGWGTWTYPLVYSLDGLHARIMPLAQLMGMLVLSIFSLLVFFTAIGGLISLFVRTTGTHFLWASALLLTGLPSVLGPATRLMPWLPVGYFDYAAVILHRTNWPTLGFGGGVGLLLGWSLLVFGGTGVLLHRRQLL